MFDLDTISSTITIAAAIGAALVTLGLLKLLLKPKRRRGKRKKINASLRCSMCQRPTPEEAINHWNIRSVTQNVCERCHPFYKLRFEGNRSGAQATPDATPTTNIAQPAAVVADRTRVHGDTAAICP